MIEIMKAHKNIYGILFVITYRIGEDKLITL